MPKHCLPNLAHFAGWIIGDAERLPLITHTGQVADFGKVLESKKAVQYLEQAQNPRFNVAIGLTEGYEHRFLADIEDIRYNLKLMMSYDPRSKDSGVMQSAIQRFKATTAQFLNRFSDN